MNTEEAIKVMTEAFGRLTAEERGNLQYHAEENTPILAGQEEAGEFYTAFGTA